MAILFNNCKQMRMTNAFNQRPRGMLMESAQGVRSTTKGGSSAAFQFYFSSFCIYNTASLFLS